jgi:hypothetical protein
MKDTIASRLAGSTLDPFIFDGVHCGPQLTEFTLVTVDEVVKLLNTMPSKSSPMDFVPTSLMKRCKGVFAPLIARLANMSFSQGRFPTQFKLAQVLPLLKKAGMDVNDPASFRPISNLNTISKIIERLALTRLRPQITASINFNKLQSAYLRNHSTETALLNILNDSYGKIDRGESTLLVALDLSAAFDTVEHSVLLTRLQHSFGVMGTVGNWITSYLTDRSQFIRVGSESSAITYCSCGVPQGSVLGPLFFVAYISPVARIANKFGVFLSQYADDTQLHVALSKKAVSVCSMFIRGSVKMDSSSTRRNPKRCSCRLYSTQDHRLRRLPT